MSQPTLEQLIPLPTITNIDHAPSPWPGVTAESAKAVATLLRQNHVKYHCFFNDEGFHNHLPHHLLAAYSLGCTPSLLEAAYKLHADYQREQKQSPEPITEQNWKGHLGKHNYYPAYLQFFQAQVIQNGMAATLEKYVFSPEANEGKTGMFARLFSGLVHPLIHFGHGPEFGLPGLAAEGLAMTAVTSNMAGGLFPPSFFEGNPTPGPGPHALTVAAHILNDPELAYGKGADPNSPARFQDAIRRSGERLRRYIDEWTPEGKFSDKYEELVWLVSSIYGFSGWRKDEDFKANFFMLHLVTSSLFVPSIHVLLSEKSQHIFLRGFLATVLTYWVGHGRRSFTVNEFFNDEGTIVLPPHTDPHPADDALDAKHLNQNPWFPILRSALNHPDEHLLKIQRSLAHYAAMYGTRPKGCLAQTELPEAESIDGTLFLRLASTTGKVKAWVREGEPSHDANWNRHY